MGEFLRILREMMRGQTNIRARLLRLLVISSLLSALVFAGLSFYGITFVRKDIADMGTQLSESGAEYTKQYINKTSKDTLAELAKAEAGYIDREMSLMQHDVQILSESLTWIQLHPENFLPGNVFDLYNGKVPPTAPCILYSPDVRKRGIETVQKEVELAANIKGTLVPMEKSYGNDSYSATYFGSKHGFLICSSVFPGDEYSPLSDDPAFDYDPRIRPWYINAVNANKAVFSLPYITILNEEHNDVEVISCSVPYYDAAGVAGVASIDMATEKLRKYIHGTIIGEKGINFVMTNEGRIVFSPQQEGVLAETDKPQDLRKSEVPELAQAAQQMAGGEKGMMPVEIGGEKYMLAFAPIPTIGWSLGILVSQDDMMSSLQESQNYYMGQMDKFKENLQNEYLFLLKAALLALFIMIVIMFFLSERLSDRFVKPIKQMADGVREIASGNLDKKLEIKTGDEIEHLAVCFNAMTDELKAYIDNLSRVTAEREKVAAELSVAQSIQLGALPQDFMTNRKDFQIYASMDAAKGVGGDFYDFYLTDENHIVITIADVSGKGIPAALYMMRAKTTLKNLVLMAQSPDDFAAVMTLANQELCRENEEMMFVTVFIAQLNLVTGELIYVNGGHNPPLVQENGRFRYLQHKKKHMMLGVNEDGLYVSHSLVLQPGDMIFLYTDGVTEAMNEEEDMYSEERLQATLNAQGEKNVKEILAAVRQDVGVYAGAAEQSDDITMLGLKFFGEMSEP
ncbi:sigma-B regulation protein RsbU (phosphoserine phosphatase) [Selenomonas ruminantium]|uniref:Sigma-B regulation protein RsbU (Phosphoserine phosphatase) n=1 Tax=Selenomonas ruminantium TaxID=971 RepID=A0A1M6RHC9_SELRU|nr:SpoIIE family protein phosphatase [Selenomonas ruminantium]SHK31852.1 sigma-B regulation protein RsbU (phosphoserine phosphatase) [Selenomonas ruminantium]